MCAEDSARYNAFSAGGSSRAGKSFRLGLEIRRVGAPQHFHFLGICGTAMGAVAAALRERGCTVTGSDENVYPPMSDFLREKGIALNEPYRAENLPDDAEVVVVIGNAIKRGNPEVEAVLNRKLYYLSLPGGAEGIFPARAAQSRRHRHAREDDHDRAAGLDFDRRGNGAGLRDRRAAAQSRAGRALQRLEIFRDRGRRIRHGFFRQALEVHPLPAGAADRE